jgi:uncharacterized membrane protein YfhO
MTPPSQGPALPQKAFSISVYDGQRIIVNSENQVNALLVLGEKYYRGWKATVDGKPAAIYPVNHILRGVYLIPGTHRVEFVFDPLPFRIGKWFTLSSFAVYAIFLGRELWLKKRSTS